MAASITSGTLVEFDFGTFGKVQFDLFDGLAPATVSNFTENYVGVGRYDQSIIHRVSKDLGIIQGGGLDSSAQPISSDADATVPLEYARANSRGTIAMARTVELNSARSQWFVNTRDNSTLFDQSNNGGYAVFGWTVGPGMQTIDAISALPTFSFQYPLDEVPLQDYTMPEPPLDPFPHLVVLQSATIIRVHPAYQNPYEPLDVNNNGTISAFDALSVIASLLESGPHVPAGPFSGSRYLDVSGDGVVSPRDALRVIAHLLNPPAEHTSAAVYLTASPIPVPEPNANVLMATALLCLAPYLLSKGSSAANRARSLPMWLRSRGSVSWNVILVEWHYEAR